MSLAHHTRVAALWLCAVSTAHAASFDCSRATDPVEKFICDSPQLSTLDDELTTTYARALKQTPNPQSLKKQQRGWLGNVRNRCDNAECVQQAYTARIAQLVSTIAFPKKTTSSGGQDDAENCHAIAHHSNRNETRFLTVDFLAKNRSQAELEPIFGADAYLSGGLSYWHVDLNGDGVRDHLAISVDGTMQASTVYARSGKKEAPVAELRPGDDFFLDVDVYAVGGMYYVSSGDVAWRMGEDGGFRKVCSFAVRERSLELVKGKKEAVCTAAAQGKLRYVTYSFTHRLSGLPEEDRFWSQSLHDGSMAKADIDNDGKIDNIVKIDYVHSAGRGCGATYVATTNERATTVPDTKINQLLLTGLDNDRCGPSLDAVFIHDGITYLDTRATAPQNQSQKSSGKIFRIKDGKAEAVCEFQERILIDAVVR